MTHLQPPIDTVITAENVDSYVKKYPKFFSEGLPTGLYDKSTLRDRRHATLADFEHRNMHIAISDVRYGYSFPWYVVGEGKGFKQDMAPVDAEAITQGEPPVTVETDKGRDMHPQPPVGTVIETKLQAFRLLWNCPDFIAHANAFNFSDRDKNIVYYSDITRANGLPYTVNALVTGFYECEEWNRPIEDEYEYDPTPDINELMLAEEAPHA